MKRMKIAIYATLAASVVLGTAQMSHAQASAATVAAITKLENDSVKADLAADKSWPEKYFAEDWVACDSSGKWYTKDDVLKMMADPANNKFNSEKLFGLKVRVYGNTAVATYSDTYDAVVQGEHRTRTILSTDVWVKIGGEWKEVSSQGTTAK